MLQSIRDRFWEKVNKKGRLMPHMKTRCWEWTGARTGGKCGGYGHLVVPTKKTRTKAAHIVAWLLSGKKVNGKLILHHCDNRICVRVSHLYSGTYIDNARDREHRGRSNHAAGNRHGCVTHPGQRVGEKNGRAKLTEILVKKLREDIASGASVSVQAKRLRITKTTAYAILHGDLWSNVSGPILPKEGRPTGDHHHMRKDEFRPRGEKNANSVLTEATVLTIRAEFDPATMEYADLARKYKVSPSTIGNIIRRETWTQI